MSPIRPRPPIWLAAALFLGALLCAANAQAALHWRPQDTALTPEQAAASRQLLDDAAKRLPAAWREALGEVTVEWRDDLPAQVVGHARSNRLRLDRALLDGWMARPREAGDGDPASQAALKALIHELAHLYDRGTHDGLSRAPRLRDLAGWQRRPLRLGMRGGNAMHDRSPDRYELHSPAEFVAVNLEYFVLDPAYACRRPQLHAYFAARFGLPQAVACTAELPYLDGEQGLATLLQLDPARIYAIDYLLAEGNDTAMSRWGHSMLRLVICAPGRPRGPDCRLDLQYHRVLSFRAFVDDVQISGWRGLTGSYPSRLFVLPLNQVVEDYTRVELRGLQSIPLWLDDAEIADLLQRAAQLHWSYDGRYYFLGNNCAVETWKLLHDGVPRLAKLPLSSITPTGLLKRLRRAGIADASVLDDGAEARRLGYYFEPASARFQAMFDVVRAALPVAQARVQDWLALPPERRQPWLQQAGLRTSAALLLLEQAALRQQELAARDALKQRMLGRGSGVSVEPDSIAPDLPATLHAVLNEEGLLSRPAALLADGGGYGLPQADERERLTAIIAGHGQRAAEGWKRLREQAREALPLRQRQRLQGTENNIAAISQRLRELHRAEGGLNL